MKPIVALVGRPNVGKSTLFNRIIRSKDALVDDFPGVTRDRLYRDARWNERDFTLVDTGGFAEGDQDHFAGQIRWQVLQAIEDADAVIFVLDGRQGVAPHDRDIAHLLRRADKPCFLVVNKTDGPDQEKNLADFYELGSDRLFPVSAEHGYGMMSFMDELAAQLPVLDDHPALEMIHVAVVGKPNAGKSSLINKLLGGKRLVVSDRPGTTRDAVDSVCTVRGNAYRLIDTAGIRRKKKVSRKLEKFSIIKALRSLDRCHIALIMIDASEGITEQDINIAGYAYERGCGCLFLLNKWDLVEKNDTTLKHFQEELRLSAKFLHFAPVLTVSALTGLRLPRIFKLVDEMYSQYATRIGTGEFNRILQSAVRDNEPSLYRGRRLKFSYGSQISTRPPTFVIFVNHPRAVHFSYRRYLVNRIREASGLDRVPVRLILRQKTGRMEFPSASGGSRRKARPSAERKKKGRRKRGG
jgi:GTP-binding protein